MAYVHGDKIKIRFDYESGKYTAGAIAKKWKMSPQTLKKFADDGGWELGCRDGELNRQIEERAKAALLKKESERLVEMIEDHLKTVEIIDDAFKILLWHHMQELKQSQGLLSESDGKKWKENYKALQVAIDSFDKSFRSKRLALGLKETDAPNMQMNVFMNKVENYKHLSDQELDYIIANEGKSEEEEAVKVN